MAASCERGGRVHGACTEVNNPCTGLGDCKWYTACVPSVSMNPEESAKLIDSAGGNTAFAELLGMTEQPWHRQRVSNWRARGIPPRVLIDFADVIERLKKSPAHRRSAA